MASPAQAMTDAIEHTKTVLFRPFDFHKWLVLGFCAFLAGLGEGGGGSGGNTNPGGRGGFRASQATDFIEEHLAVILLIALAVLVVAVAFGALLTWLSSRGKFMFLHGVASNRAAVVQPWHWFRELGNNLFAFRFLVGLAVLVFFLLVAAGAGLVAWPDLRADRFGPGAIAALLGGVGLLLLAGLAMLILFAVVEDFAVPVMYARNVRVREALRVFRAEVLPGHVGAILLFYLLKIAVGLVLGIVMIMVVCLTCCLAGLPYVSSVIFLPVTVFFRSWSVLFLEQMADVRVLRGPEPFLAAPPPDELPTPAPPAF